MAQPQPRRFLSRYHDVHVHVAADLTYLRPGADASGLVYVIWPPPSQSSPHPPSPAPGHHQDHDRDRDHQQHHFRILATSVTLHPEAARRKRNAAYVPGRVPAAHEDALGHRVNHQHDLRALPSRAACPPFVPLPRRGPKNAPFVYATEPLTQPIPAVVGTPHLIPPPPPLLSSASTSPPHIHHHLIMDNDDDARNDGNDDNDDPQPSITASTHVTPNDSRRFHTTPYHIQTLHRRFPRAAAWAALRRSRLRPLRTTSATRPVSSSPNGITISRDPTATATLQNSDISPYRHRSWRIRSRGPPDPACDVITVIPFHFKIPDHIPESASFMENEKKDCRIDIRVRIAAAVQIYVPLQKCDTLPSMSPHPNHVVTILAENVVKILPPCRPPLHYPLAPPLAAAFIPPPSHPFRAISSMSVVSTSTVSTGVNNNNATTISTNNPPSSATPHCDLACDDDNSPHATVDPALLESVSFGSLSGAISANLGPAPLIGGLYTAPSYVMHVNATRCTRVGNPIDAKIKIRVKGKSPEHSIHLRLTVLQRVYFGSGEPRARRALSNDLFVSLDHLGEGEVSAHFAPTRRSAFYPTTTVGALRIQHVVRVQVFDKGILFGVSEVPVVLLPGDPTPETYRAQNPSHLPTWCGVAQRRFRCPVQPFELNSDQMDEVCVVCLDNLSARPVTKIVRCGHYGHVDCMEQWVDCKPVCPMCNCPISDFHANAKNISCCPAHVYDLASPSLTLPFG